MREVRFDRLVRLLSSAGNRRASRRVFAGLALLAFPTADSLARKKKKRKCRGGTVRCSGACRDLRQDASNCGACGVRCPAGAPCLAGVCQPQDPGPNCAPPCSTATSRCGVTPAGCAIFPTDNIWNTRVDALPLDPRSAQYIASIGNNGLHADFGSGLYEGRPIGIPFVSVPASQPLVPITFTDYGDESDAGPYPIPPDAPVEGGLCPENGDRHVLVLSEGSCQLYELFNAAALRGGSWRASSGAHYDLRSHDLREDGWTSADAAGLPILPGLVRYEEVAAGVIPHALRFTASSTRQAHVWPARHDAGDSNSLSVPPMGQRFRLRGDFDSSDFSPENQVILTALKRYGMLLADNGSDWFLSGAPDERWDNDDLRELKERVHGNDFEAVDCSSLMDDPDSGQVG